MADIVELDLKDSAIRSRVLDLQKMVFDGFDMQLLEHILIDSNSRSTAIGAFEGGKLAAVNGFIAHDVCSNGEISVAYQSCMSATDPEFAGRGLFTSIINGAKRILADRGGGFIFGYPNNKSAPIFSKKLGFSEQSMSIVDIPLATTPVVRLVFKPDEFVSFASGFRSITFDARRTAEWKIGRPGRERIESFENYTNFLFGRRSKKNAGPFALSVFNVGGFEINKPLILPELLRNISRGGPCHVVRFVVPTRSAMAHAFRGSRVATKTEPLICFPLNLDLNGAAVEAWSGLKDVF